MTKRIIVLSGLLALLVSRVYLQAGDVRVRPAARCQLTQDDYNVYAGLILGLGQPEDPEEAWGGREIMLVDVTQAPDPRVVKGRWGWHAISRAAHASETIADFEAKLRSSCDVKPISLASQVVRMVTKKEVDAIFASRADGWDEFYRKYPNTGGLWSVSRPGYNSKHDEAEVCVSHSCGPLCGTGHLYLLAKENGHWKVKNRVMLWIS